MTKIIKAIETPMGLCELGENGILYNTGTDKDVSLDQAKEYIHLVRQEFGFTKENQARVIIRAATNNPANKEIRDYFAQPEVAITSKALAFAVSSSVARIGINLFMTFSKPPYPTKAFTNEAKAEEWLLSLK